MSDRQWTEGPWVATEVYQDEIGWPVVDVMAQGWPECPVATVRGRTAQEAIANAHLAAVAPDLYEACEEALRVLEVRGTKLAAERMAVRMLTRALLRARGESHE